MYTTLPVWVRQFLASFVVLAALLLFASASTAWTGPTQTAPAGNVAAPLNTGASSQTKTGGLTVGSGASTVVVSSGGVAANILCLGGDCIDSWAGAGEVLHSGTLCGAWLSGSANLGNHHTSCQGLPRAQCPAGYASRIMHEANGVYMYSCYKL